MKLVLDYPQLLALFLAFKDKQKGLVKTNTLESRLYQEILKRIYKRLWLKVVMNKSRNSVCFSTDEEIVIEVLFGGLPLATINQKAEEISSRKKIKSKHETEAN